MRIFFNKYIALVLCIGLCGCSTSGDYKIPYNRVPTGIYRSGVSSLEKQHKMVRVPTGTYHSGVFTLEADPNSVKLKKGGIFAELPNQLNKEIDDIYDELRKYTIEIVNNKKIKVTAHESPPFEERIWYFPIPDRKNISAYYFLDATANNVRLYIQDRGEKIEVASLPNKLNQKIYSDEDLTHEFPYTLKLTTDEIQIKRHKTSAIGEKVWHFKK